MSITTNIRSKGMVTTDIGFKGTIVIGRTDH
jgi:hypothetical protein